MSVPKVKQPVKYFVEEYCADANAGDILWEGGLTAPPAVGDTIIYGGVTYVVNEKIWSTADETLGSVGEGHHHEFRSDDLVCLTLVVSRRASRHWFSNIISRIRPD